MGDTLVAVLVVAGAVAVGWLVLRSAIGIILKALVGIAILAAATWFLWPIVAGFDLAEIKRTAAAAVGAAGGLVVVMLVLDDLFGSGD